MIKDNQKRLNRMHVLLDILVTVVAYALAWFIVISGKVLPLDEGVLKPQVYFMALIFIVPIYLILYASFHLYVPKRIQGRRSELANICKANVIGLMLFTFVLFGLRRFVSHLSYFSTKMILAFFAANIILLEAERISIRIFLRSLRTNGYNQKHVLLIGYSRAAEGFIDRVSVNPEWGYHVQGILDDHRPAGFAYKKVQVLGPTNHLEDFLASNTLDEIAITLSIKEYSNLEQIVAACEKSGVHTKFIPDYNNIIPTIPYMEDLQGLPVIHIRHVPLTGVFNATMKRIVDLAGALFGLIVFSPLMLVTALLIKITSPGPVLFSQERIGLHNRPFKMYKFRSMYIDAEERKKELMAQNEMDGLMFKMEDDPRITKVGKFLRKTSLDEFPQFINILKGDMSLVGTRPPTLDEFENYQSYHKKRLSFRPGLTGMWQVSGRSDITDFEEIVRLDVEYIDNWSVGLDIKILIKTVLAVFSESGAR